MASFLEFEVGRIVFPDEFPMRYGIIFVQKVQVIVPSAIFDTKIIPIYQ